jgi:hypothetical protein
MTDRSANWGDSEPVIHSHVTDSLPDDHPLAFEQVYCDGCGRLVHAGNNECMTTWLEWGPYKLCGHCASPLFQKGVLSAVDFKELAEKGKTR